MSINVSGSGEACCGNCSSPLAIVCTGGCADPDIVFRENAIAALPIPKDESKKRAKYPPPTHCWCGEPVAPRAKFGVGRPPTKCEKHLKRRKKVEDIAA